MSTTSEDFGVALAKELCPICAKEIDGPIIMGTIMSKKNAQKVNKMNGQVIGWSPKPCLECQEILDKNAIFIIGVDIEKSNNGNMHRTGHLIAINRDSDFVKSLPDEYFKQKAICMDYREMIRIGMIDIEEHGD